MRNDLAGFSGNCLSSGLIFSLNNTQRKSLRGLNRLNSCLWYLRHPLQNFSQPVMPVARALTDPRASDTLQPTSITLYRTRFQSLSGFKVILRPLFLMGRPYQTTAPVSVNRWRCLIQFWGSVSMLEQIHNHPFSWRIHLAQLSTDMCSRWAWASHTLFIAFG